MSAFGGARGLKPKPPEKGVFPLDHFGECSTEMKNYLSCLSKNDDNGAACNEMSRKYLECRMEKNLMAKQSLEEFGIATEVAKDTIGKKEKRTKQKAYIAGLPHRD